MATRPKTRTTRTRTELDEELSEVRSTATHREVLDPKTLEAQRRQDQATRQAAAALTVQKAAQKVAQVGIDIQGAVAKVSEQLMETTQELETVQRAVVLEREELAELHGKDVIASSIDALLVQHGEQEKQLETTIAAKRQQWQEEQATHAKALQEREAEIARTRQREEDDYRYKTAQVRRDATDKFDDELRARDKASRERAGSLRRVGFFARKESSLARRSLPTPSPRLQPSMLKTRRQNPGLPLSVLSSEISSIRRHSLRPPRHRSWLFPNSAIRLLTQRTRLWPSRSFRFRRPWMPLVSRSRRLRPSRSKAPLAAWLSPS